MKVFLLFLSLFISQNLPQQRVIEWRIEPNSSITFKGSQVEGSFESLGGEIIFDPSNLESSRFDVVIDPSSISTGNTTKDSHARSENWLNVTKYSSIKFTSTKISKKGNAFVVEGILDFHGEKRTISIPFTFEPQASGTSVLSGEFKLNRRDYGIKGPVMGFLVGNDFEVKIRVPISSKKSDLLTLTTLLRSDFENFNSFKNDISLYLKKTLSLPINPIAHFRICSQSLKSPGTIPKNNLAIKSSNFFPFEGKLPAKTFLLMGFNPLATLSA
jgi:polyisoprenoid-binding protein YceI